MFENIRLMFAIAMGIALLVFGGCAGCGTCTAPTPSDGPAPQLPTMKPWWACL